MTGLNKYYRRSHISEPKFRQIIQLFCHDLCASTAAEMTGISRVSINKIYLKLRLRIAYLCEQASPLSGEVEVDESYFGTGLYGMAKRRAERHAENPLPARRGGFLRQQKRDTSK